MNIFISVTVIFSIIAAGVYLHFKLFKLKTVADFESIAESKLQARAHRLVSMRLDIDLMPQSHQKLEAHDEWIGKIYEYMEDYETSVAEEMKKGKFSGVKAYGGIKLIG